MTKKTINLPNAKYGITFDAKNHTYDINGFPARSVTEILRLSGMRKIWNCDEYYRDRGNYVHSALAMYFKDTLDEASLTDGVVGYVRSGMRLLRNYWTNVRKIAIEFTVGSVTHGYAGTLDLLAEINGRIEIIDWKTSAPRGTLRNADLLQVAGYAIALEEQYGIRPDACTVVYLDKNGKIPKCVTGGGPTERARFLTCVNWLKARDYYNPIEEDDDNDKQ